jgi:hypothetical protein
MAASTKSYTKYELSGTAQSQFPFDFPYFNVSDITVELPPDYTGTYTINASTNTVELSSPISVGTVLIRRHTPQAVKHIFANMMRFNFKAVDANFKQCLYWFQEAIDSIDFLSAGALATRIEEVEATAAGWIAEEAAARGTAISNERAAWQQGDTGLAQQITTNLAASTGAALIGFLQPGVGTVRRTILDRLLDRVSLFDFMTPAQIADVRAGTRLVDVTAAVQAAIDYAVANGKALVGPAGAYLVGPINFNGTGHTTAADVQWPGLLSFRGEGRRSTVFVAKTGAYASNQYVVSGNNLSGVSYSGFGVDGAGVTTRGIDFSWNGGSSGGATSAPSNQNVFKDIFCQGCSTTAFNLTQCHDSKISGLWCRGVSVGSAAVILAGAGGKLGVDNMYIGSGVLQLSCQNAALHNCGFFGGVVLNGSGYNVAHFSGVHVYPDSTTGLSVNSIATGNATRGVLWTGCYFDVGATYSIAGRYWNGMVFQACRFCSASSGILSPSIITAAGAGSPPLFKFDHCDFDSTLPVAVPGVAVVCLHGCRNSGGVTITDLGPINTTASITATAERHTFGASTIIDAVAGTNVASGSGITLKVSIGTFLLSVSNINTSGANVRTNSLYFVGTYQGDGFTVTQIASSNGSGGGRTFTVTAPTSSTIVITNTSGGATNINAALFGVGV